MDTDREILAGVAEPKYCDNFNITIDNTALVQKDENSQSILEIVYVLDSIQIDEKVMTLNESEIPKINYRTASRVSDLVATLAKDLGENGVTG